MPRSKDLKRIIRGRMKKTGESYTAARTQIISKARPKTPPDARVDLAAQAGMSDEKIAAKTGRTWKEWVHALDAAGAAGRPHREIAILVRETYGVGDWWTQAVTVGYERIKGLRDRGQRRDGGYEVNKSKTVPVAVEALYEAWANDGIRRRWLDRTDATVRSTSASKAIRLRWPDGTIVIAGFTPKGSGKSAVALAHTKLPDRRTAEDTRKYWTARLDALARLLARS